MNNFASLLLLRLSSTLLFLLPDSVVGQRYTDSVVEQRYGYANLTADWIVSPIAQRNKAYCALKRAHPFALTDVGYVVVRNGEIVAEDYRFTFSGETKAAVWSTTKSWTSTIFGHLVTNDSIDLTWTLGEVFSNDEDWVGVSDADRKKSVTVKEILNFSGGLEETEESQSSEQETLQEVLNGLTYDPEERGTFNYLASNHISSRIILEVTGMTPREYAINSGFFEALGVHEGDYEWQTFGGVEGSAYGLLTNPRTQAKLGTLMLQNGLVSDERQLIDSAYVRRATTNQLPGGGTLGGAAGPWYEYGYNWYGDLTPDGWFDPIPDLEGSFAALGLFGNKIVVLPKLNVVIAMTSFSVDILSIIYPILNNLDNLYIEEDCSGPISTVVGTAVLGPVEWLLGLSTRIFLDLTTSIEGLFYGILTP